MSISDVGEHQYLTKLTKSWLKYFDRQSVYDYTYNTVS
jgi:hypothetical protein